MRIFDVVQESEENKGEYVTRTLKVTFKKVSKAFGFSWKFILLSPTHADMSNPAIFQESRSLKQLHYVNWPDHGVPDSIPPILHLLQDMRIYQDHEDVPIIIHCR